MQLSSDGPVLGALLFDASWVAIALAVVDCTSSKQVHEVIPHVKL